MKKIMLITAVLAISLTATAGILEWDGEKLTRSRFNKLYKDWKNRLFVWNGEIIKVYNEETGESPYMHDLKRGELGIVLFTKYKKYKNGNRDKFGYVGTYNECFAKVWDSRCKHFRFALIEDYTNYIMPLSKRRDILVACGLYVGTVKYGEATYPIIKLLPHVTKRQFKKYIRMRMAKTTFVTDDED